jgi:hypothetical protein
MNEGDVVVVNSEVCTHEPLASIDALKQRLDDASASLQRWKLVGIDTMVKQCCDEQELVISDICAELLTLNGVTKTFCEAHLAPNFSIKPPPTLTRLDCEKASELLEIRSKLGIQDVEKSLLDALEEFKKC